MALILGIDLGTTHSALASVDPSLGPSAPVVDFPVPQLVRPGEVAARPLLPSCVYLPGPELPVSARSLPWEEPPDAVSGELARWQGARVPGRLIASAKSWLCHPGVDRQAPILPWAAPPEVTKLSPVAASARLLGHLVRAWDQAHPEAKVAEQEVVLTVPASFDEAARALTVSAARQAGLVRFHLLEEPQAAFYDFTARHRLDLEKTLAQVALVLVVDVGGGTTDFTLVHAGVTPEGPVLKRLAVGDHLLLGGDNMDAAIAHRAEQKLLGEGKRLSAASWTQLVQAARGAKEALLGVSPPGQVGVSVAADGARLLGKTLSTELTREEVEAAVVEGFFPQVTASEVPRRAARMGVQELGLPYAQDPAITRHLVAFLRQHASAGFTALGEAPPVHPEPVEGSANPGGTSPPPGGSPDRLGALPRPDAILLNGGVFNSPALAERIVATLSAIWPDRPRIALLRHGSLDLAVARGAAYSGLVRRGHGLKIGGGAARAYYVGLGSAGEGQAVCLIPRGFEEGLTAPLGERRFTLTLGRPVAFQLYATTADRIDKPGDLTALDEALRPLPPIHTVLKGREGRQGTVPVRLEATLTEIGTLELWCVADDGERWRLEFELRGAQARADLTVTESLPPRFAEASEAIERIFGHKPLPVGPKDVKQLFRAVEKVLGPKEGFRLPVLRELWGALFAGAPKRRRTADHERVFFQLLGYCLRPGFGYPLDGWRCEQTFALFAPLVQFSPDKAVWIEFWVMWRRITGGLSEQAHQALWAYLEPHLERRVPPQPPKLPKLKGIVPEGLDEMVRTAASLEHLEPAQKVTLGRWIADRLKSGEAAGGVWAWALGRLGARAPLFGSVHRTVPPEVASDWLTLLLDLGLSKVEGAPFAAVQLARLTGDRARDLDDTLRARTLAALDGAHAQEGWRRMLSEVVALEAADEARALGDTLPAGLQLA